MTEQDRKILIVDDETSMGRILKAGLEMHGFPVRFEARSIDAIKTCLEFHPDLVLLDVDMPVKDGGTVAAELQSHPTLRHTPVIFLTLLVKKEEAANRPRPARYSCPNPFPFQSWSPEFVPSCDHRLHPELPSAFLRLCGAIFDDA